MKNLFILITIFLWTSIGFSQEEEEEDRCPPGAWCHPNGSGMGYTSDYEIQDPFTLSGILTGENLNKTAAESGCSDSSWDPSCWFADWFPCGYGGNTPQASLCDEPDPEPEPAPAPNPEPTPEPAPEPAPEPTEETPQMQGYYTNPNFNAGYFSTGNAKKNVKIFFNKKKRGDVVHRWKKGHTLHLAYKYYQDKSKKEYVVVLEMKNKKGKVVGRPILATKGKNVHVLDLIKKPKKKRRRK